MLEKVAARLSEGGQYFETLRQSQRLANQDLGLFLSNKPIPKLQQDSHRSLDWEELWEVPLSPLNGTCTLGTMELITMYL